jgi:HEAT repeat protein
LTFLTRKKPEIRILVEEKNVNGLIQALRHQEFDIQWQAADALGRMGEHALDSLLSALKNKNRDVRIGVIEALGEIKNPRAVPVLVELLKDPSIEVRWAAAIALGEMKDPAAVESLQVALRDGDKYVRYGAAIALEKIGWTPANDEEKAYYLVGKQEWEELRNLEITAIKPLAKALNDKNTDVRIKVVEILGEIGQPQAISALVRALRDENPQVRWKAVVASQKCGFSPMFLPRALNRRPRVRKNPRIAALLNFLLPGQGYNYLGFWWGTVIFQAELSLTLYMLAFAGEAVTYTMLFPLYGIVAIHGWYMAKKMPEL